MPVIALTLLAAGLRFYGLGHQGFWYDEASTALLVKLTPGQMLGLIPQSESTPPLYYCVAWVWARVFGDTEAGLRSLSAVAGRAGGAGGLLRRCEAARVSPGGPDHGGADRVQPTADLVLAGGTGVCTAGAAVRSGDARVRLRPNDPRSTDPRRLGAGRRAGPADPLLRRRRDRAAGGGLLYERPHRRSLHVAIACLAIVGLALSPLAVAQSNRGNDGWIARTSLRLRLAQVVPQFLLGTGTPAREALKFAAFALTAVALWLLAFRTRRRERWPALLAAGLAVTGFVIGLVFVAGGDDTLITRNILPLWLPCAMASAGGLAAARARWLGAAVAVGLCGIGLTAAIGVAAQYDLQRPNWRPVAAALGPWPAGRENHAGRRGARVVVIQDDLERLPLALYMPGLDYLRGNPRTRVTEVDVISIHSPGQPLCWWGAACNLITSATQADYTIPGLREVTRATDRAVHDHCPARRRSGDCDPRRARLGADDDAAVARRGPDPAVERAFGPAGSAWRLLPDPALRSRLTSAAVRSLTAPTGRSPSRSGPNRTRCSDRTGWPTCSHMRRI